MKKLTKRFFRLLKEELELWKEEGIVSEEQAEKIKERYRLQEIKEFGIPPKFITVISIIGALLVGVGVILFIASNWKNIPKLARLITIFVVIFSVNHFGYYLKFTRKNYPKTGSALLFLGSLLFGGGIWLVAQTYHITSRYHNGMLFWALGIIPVSWLLSLEPILLLSSVLLTFWTIWKVMDYSIPNYFYLILMLSIILPLCYKQTAKVSLFLSLVGILLWFSFGPCSYYFEGATLPTLLCFISIGTFLYSVGLLHALVEKIRENQTIYKFVGVFILFVVIYIISFKDVQIRLLLSITELPPSFWSIYGIISLLSITVIFAIFRLMQKKSQNYSKLLNYEISIVIFCLLFPILIIIFPSFTFYAITSNLILLGLTIGIVFLGYYNRWASFVNLGFIFFGIHLLTRYIDWGYKYLPRSLFFIITGFILILAATFMEKNRKKIIKAIRKEK